MKPPYNSNQTTKYFADISDQDIFYRVDIFMVPKLKINEIRRGPNDLYRKKSLSMKKTKNLNKCYKVYKENEVLGTKLFIKSLKKDTKDPFLKDLIEKIEKGTLEIVSKKRWFTLDFNY